MIPDVATVEAIDAEIASWCEAHGRRSNLFGELDEVTVAALLGVSPDTLRAWARDGSCPMLRVQRVLAHRRWYRRRDVSKFLAYSADNADNPFE